MARKMESDPESVVLSGTGTVELYQKLISSSDWYGPIVTPSFNEIGSLLFQ